MNKKTSWSTINCVSQWTIHSSRIGWSRLLIASRLRNWITLDNGATLSLFSSLELVVGDIQTSSKALVVLATNARVMPSNQDRRLYQDFENTRISKSRFQEGRHCKQLQTIRSEDKTPDPVWFQKGRCFPCPCGEKNYQVGVQPWRAIPIWGIQDL